MICYILLCGYPPFWGDSEKEIFLRVKKGQFDFPVEEWANVSKEAKDIISKMLTVDPLKRITAKEALNHPWFSNSTAQNTLLKGEVLARLTDFTNQNKLKRYALALIAHWLDEKEIKNLRQQFQTIDVDGNGTISVAELAQAMRKAGFHPSNQEVTTLIDRMDADGNGKLDYTAFIAATMEEHQYFKDELLQKVFEELDKDRTGKLALEKLGAK